MDQFMKFDLRSSQIRIVYIMIGSMFLVHLFACFFYLSAKMHDFESNTWVTQLGLNDNSMAFMYCRSAYWAFQTLTTVGYGDFGAYNGWEIALTCMWMFMGVAIYSVVVGALTVLILEKTEEEDNVVNMLKALTEF